MNADTTKSLHLAFWFNSKTYPQSHGYTPQTPEDMATLRIGPLCICWEVVES